MSQNNPVGSPQYASATWENGDGESIPDFSLDTNVPGKFKTTISTILSKHCAEVKLSSDDIVQPIISLSKKKLKELITRHNNEMFSFMARPDRTPHMIGLAETIFRRYGHDVPSIKGNSSASMLRDLNLDASMCSVTAFFDEGLKKNTSATDVLGLDDFLRQTRWMFNQYRIIGEEVIRL